jgi:uncharacterized protein YecE (DUF72 family)
MRRRKYIHIGTSGWNYEHWKRVFYPPDISSNDWLKFYADTFDTVEINNTFYKLPSKDTIKKWHDTVKKNFLFTVKASRYITHMKKLKEPKDALKQFFKNVENLGDKLGPILFQLPPRWKINSERLNSFLRLLSKDFRYTFEFRDSSWWDQSTYECLQKYNSAFCIYELAGTVSPKEVTADFIYIRLHGPDGAYQGSYETKTLSGWVGAFSAWTKKKKEVFCYFDNDQNGYAALNARQLKKMVD